MKNELKIGVEHLLGSHNVALIIFPLNAPQNLEAIIGRIPDVILQALVHIIVISDKTCDTRMALIEAGNRSGLANLCSLHCEKKLDYGEARKIGYGYAVQQNIEYLVLLQNNGEYFVEYLTSILHQFESGTDVIFGSRKLQRYSGSIDTKTLCAIRVSVLRCIPFKYNSNSIYFDMDILVQILSLSAKVYDVELIVNEKRKDILQEVKCFWYGIKSFVKYRLFKMGLFYDPFLDFGLFDTEHYFLKQSPNSLHQFVLNKDIVPAALILDFGAASGAFSEALAKKDCSVVVVDRIPPRASDNVTAIGFDLNEDFTAVFKPGEFDVVIALDVVEHLEDPEGCMKKLAHIVKSDGLLFASTGNISYFVMRLMLLLGIFNYGKRGILDMTHKRLFTIKSFRTLLETYGFEALEIHGFGPPIRDLISRKWPYVLLDSVLSLLARIWPSLFAYNFLIIAKRVPQFDDVYAGVMVTTSRK